MGDGGTWRFDCTVFFFKLLYVYFVCLLGFEGEILALEAKLKELNEKEAEFTDAIKQQEGKIESVKMEFAPQQNALDKRQEEIEEREKTIQQEYVSNETPILRRVLGCSTVMCIATSIPRNRSK